MSAAVSRDPTRVRQMFGKIAGRYDLLNHVLSANIDRRWRRRAAARVAEGSPLRRVLDLCGGTGDLSLALARATPEAEIVCCDFSPPMLERAERKFRKRGLDRCRTVEGDALALPFESGAFDAVTVAFGIRNLVDRDAGLREILRVLRPAGQLVVLEFSQPDSGILSRLYRTYLDSILPRLGGVVSGEGEAYRYLAKTIDRFPAPESLAGQIRDNGFAACGWERLSGGIVAIHHAFKNA